MKVDFSKLIFTDESQMIFDSPDGWENRWILSNSHVPVSLKKATRRR